MRRRFFVNEVRNGHAEIDGDEAKHLTRVLRVEAGQRYEISDNRTVFLAEIETARKEHVIFKTIEKLPPPPAQASITLCAALIKFDHFEWMIEKATELGVSKIVPVLAARTEKGLDRAALKRVERWRRIALEASQQARRAFLPEISPPQAIAQAFANDLPSDQQRKYALAEEPGTPLLGNALPAERSASDEVAILIGPEGGWAKEERTLFIECGWSPVSLGPLILRAETAAIAALAVIRTAWLH